MIKPNEFFNKINKINKMKPKKRVRKKEFQLKISLTFR